MTNPASPAPKQASANLRLEIRKAILLALISSFTTVLLAWLAGRSTVESAARSTAQVTAEAVAKQTLADLKGVPIGTIVGSVLAPQDFAKLMGKEWVPADGRTVPGSAFGVQPVPDLRGVFLRGLNVFDPQRQPPSNGQLDQTPSATGRKAGDYSPDSVGSHTHTLLKGATDVTGKMMTSGSRRIPSDVIDEYAAGPPFTSGSSGAAETTPKSVGVYWYIRVA